MRRLFGDLRTVVGEQGAIQFGLTILLAILLLPFYIGCYIWQRAMHQTMVAFEEMLEADLERHAHTDPGTRDRTSAQVGPGSTGA